MRISSGVIVAIVLILVALGIWWIASGGSAGEPTVTEQKTQQYVSSTYGYRFSYPASLILQEYSPQYVSVGRQQGGIYEGAANIELETADASSTFSSYETFVVQRAALRCAADSPSETYSCSESPSTTPFTTESGLSGEALTFPLVHATRGTTTASTTSEFGPVYAFNIGANAPDAQYAVLLIYQPLSTFLPAPDVGLVRGIADSLQIEKLEAR